MRTLASEYLPQANEVQEAAVTLRAPLTMRSPEEIVAFHFDDSDNLMGDRLLAKGQPLVLCGPGGTGKSRIVLQIAVCTSVGKPFGPLKVSANGLRWVIFQTENNNRRLQSDLKALRSWLGDEGWRIFSSNVLIHTLETEDDGFILLQDLEVRQQIERVLSEFKPDVVVFDPLGDFLGGNLNEDLAMREGCRLLSQIAKAGNPERAIVVVHHAGTGRAGIAKAVGWDRTGFGRNSKALHSWTRAQINVVPGSDDNNGTLVFSCGKSNNGAEFKPFAMTLSAAGIYEPAPGFDLMAWQLDLSGRARKNSQWVEAVVTCLTVPASKKNLVRALMDEKGCGRSAAYKAVEEAEARNLIRFDTKEKLYHAIEQPF